MATDQTLHDSFKIFTCKGDITIYGRCCQRFKSSFARVRKVASLYPLCKSCQIAFYRSIILFGRTSFNMSSVRACQNGRHWHETFDRCLWSLGAGPNVSRYRRCRFEFPLTIGTCTICCQCMDTLDVLVEGLVRRKDGVAFITKMAFFFFLLLFHT